LTKDGQCQCKKKDCKSAGKHPIFSGAKRGATIDPDQIRLEGNRYPDANVGLHLGLSGLVCVDVDPRNGGGETLTRLETQHGCLDAGIVAKTGGDGTHHFFKAGETPVSRGAKLGAGIDLLQNNLYPVIPPSTHASGRAYQWARGSDPWSAGFLLSPVPAWLLDILSSRSAETQDQKIDHDEFGVALSTEGFVWDIDSTARLRSALRFIPADDYKTWLRVGAAIHHAFGGREDGRELWDEWSLGSDYFEGCPAKYVADEQERTWGSFDATRPGGVTVGSIYYDAKEQGWVDPRKGSDPDTLGDISNGERFAARYRGRFLYCHSDKMWRLWDGQRWAICGSCEEIEAAKDVAHEMMREAISNIDTDDLGKGPSEAYKQARLVHRSIARIKAMVELAQSAPGMSVSSSAAFDADPWLLGVPNGVVDLQTGKLRASDPVLRISKQAGVDFDPDAECPLWDDFLTSTFGNHATVAFIHRAIGYTLTGSITEEKLFFLHGNGRNGKSVFANVLSALLGEYSMTVGPELLKASKHNDREAMLAKAELPGARLVLANEVGQSDTWHDQRTKEITSRERISARTNYSRPFSFLPTHKTWVRGNYKPAILDSGEAMWRRLVLIPFLVQIAQGEEDPHLEEKLLKELPGIMARAVRGCLDWQRGGLRIPRSIQAATAQYRVDTDITGQWIDQDCEARAGDRILIWEAFACYQHFCNEANVSTESRPAFTRRMEARGFPKQKSNGKDYLRGLRLRPREEPSHRDFSEDDTL
jgi:putative DNA primase/helicase